MEFLSSKIVDIINLQTLLRPHSLPSVLNVTVYASSEVDITTQYAIYHFLPALARPFSVFEMNDRDYPSLLLTDAPPAFTCG